MSFKIKNPGLLILKDMVKGKKSAVDSEDYSTWTVLELRDTLKSNNLSTEGNKKQLIARLKAAPVKEYSEYSVVELRDLLTANGLTTKGNKKDLIKRLEDYDENGTDSEQKEESEEEESEEDDKKKRKKNSLSGTKRKSNGKESSKSPARKKAKTSLKFEEENIYCDDEIPSFNTGDLYVFFTISFFCHFLIKKLLFCFVTATIAKTFQNPLFVKLKMVVPR